MPLSIPSDPLQGYATPPRQDGSSMQDIYPPNDFNKPADVDGTAREWVGEPEPVQGPIPDMARRGSASHRRTGSSIKSAMRRIFSRRKRNKLNSLEGDVMHHSSSVEAIEEGTPLFAGTSQLSSFRNDSLRPEDARRRGPTSENGEGAEVTARPRPPVTRRATIPSLVFLDDDSCANLAGNRDRNSSADGQVQQHSASLQAKRRSQSLVTLRGTTNYHGVSPVQWQRHSADLSPINHWKPSVLETASTSDFFVEPTTMTTSNEPRPSQPFVSEAEQEHELENNNNIAFSAKDLFKTMPLDDGITLEQRLTTVEVKLIDLELAIARMQSNSPKSSSTDKSRLKEPSSPSLTRNHARSQSSEPPSLALNETLHGSGQEEDRHLSMSTVRPNQRLQVPSISSMSDTGPVSIEQYSALLMLLRRERSARRSLEGQMASLQEDVRQLQDVTRSSTSIGSRYPIQSMHSEEYLRLQQTMNKPPNRTPGSNNEKVELRPIYDSTSDSGFASKDDGFSSGQHAWQASRRIEISGMI